MTEKVTTMILSVDLQCSSCYKKIKKILCKFPEIRDQVFDEKQNTVTITVICCNPNKIRDKLCCKGEKIIKSIDIKEPPKPKKNEPEKQKVTQDKSKSNGKAENPPTEKSQKEAPTKAKPTTPPPQPVVTVYPPGYRVCCGPCSEGISGGPCYHGLGTPPPPPPPPHGYPPIRPCYCYEGYGRPCYMTHCECYTVYTEGPSSTCRVM